MHICHWLWMLYCPLKNQRKKEVNHGQHEIISNEHCLYWSDPKGDPNVLGTKTRFLYSWERTLSTVRIKTSPLRTLEPSLVPFPVLRSLAFFPWFFFFKMTRSFWKMNLMNELENRKKWQAIQATYICIFSPSIVTLAVNECSSRTFTSITCSFTTTSTCACIGEWNNLILEKEPFNLDPIQTLTCCLCPSHFLSIHL